MVFTGIRPDHFWAGVCFRGSWRGGICAVVHMITSYQDPLFQSHWLLSPCCILTISLLPQIKQTPKIWSLEALLYLVKTSFILWVPLQDFGARKILFLFFCWKNSCLSNKCLAVQVRWKRGHIWKGKGNIAVIHQKVFPPCKGDLPRFPRWRGFLGHGTFGAEPGKVLCKPGWVVHPTLKYY